MLFLKDIKINTIVERNRTIDVIVKVSITFPNPEPLLSLKIWKIETIIPTAKIPYKILIPCSFIF
ncbi:hypothetical protein BTO17_04820 [Polaribacter reichenbachii]|uniref:Uncharacterized protein n=1 Tax=Polaribacter reichenbachii TaxID=996801 RepID=A0A1B8TZM5_9FLAO|nr:hypothetical protein BTO17_04820 [Polaribacter reichenbachii]OBY65035.1 hypothetical protein LPB301_09460 [Polaribacter reichenbachii]